MIALIFSLLLAVHADDPNDVIAQSLMDKLTKVNQGLAANDSSKPGIVLRLADLHAEKARKLAMKEINDGCSKVCNAGEKDRAQAIVYYNEVLAQLNGEQKSKVLVQVGHLHELNGQTDKAITIYKGLVNDPVVPIASEAQLSLAEVQFKARNWKEALAFYQRVKSTHPSQKGLAAYRVGWCYFNLSQVTPAVDELKALLKNPEMLARGANTVDTEFQEEVSRDLATFISGRGYKAEELQELYDLSPAKAKIANLSYLSSEFERTGQVPGAIASWRFVIAHQDAAKDRLEGHVHLAQLQALHQDRPAAIQDFETALTIWGSMGDCKEDVCKTLRIRLRQFVVDWNTQEKTMPSAELLTAYQKYLVVFPADIDMRLWQAQVAAMLKQHEFATQEYLKVAEALSAENAKTKLDKTKLTWLEASLLSAMENAELAKKPELEDKATLAYLNMSIDRKQEHAVTYTRAHTVYEAGNYAAAADAMKAIATNAKAPMNFRTQAADLALDSLVLLKDDARLETWSKELSKAIPAEAKDYMSLARKSILTQSTQLGEAGELEKSWVTLNRFDATGATQEEKTNYYKNKLILAEKLKRYPEAREAVDQLLKQPGLAANDMQYALSRKAWLAEMQLDFPTALAATEKLAPTKELDSTGHLLKLAMLAELSEKDPSAHYKKFVQQSKDQEKNIAVATQLVRSSQNPLKDFESYKNILIQKPELYTELLYEIYAKTGKPELVSRLTADPKLAATPYGKSAARIELFASYQQIKEKLAKAAIDSSTQRKLNATLKNRVALIDQAEKLGAKAVASQEWASQILFLNMLAAEHKKFFDEVLSLPVPQGLSPEEEQQYLGLLSQQAAPHQAKATDIQAKLKEIYANQEAFNQFAAAVSTEKEPMKKILVEQMAVVKATVPAEQQALLVERQPAAVAADGKAAAPVLPTAEQVEKARADVRNKPFDGASIQALLQMEKQLGRESMVAYLQSRLNTLTAAPAEKASVKQ